ncbi:LysM-like peptidoglycan-binding domain-containing protein [Vagococcus sp. WN89Y]|uniref:LysM-like peptidoglycan-binding domain-containing protein n=1 Tax=Vagococcus sp. WN89Y TaxID=3457258 RepID=UPI003FCD47C2
MPGRFELKPTLVKIWHAPDNFRLMDPLPPGHRRGLIFAALLVVIGFLLPVPDDTSLPARRDAQIDLPASGQAPPPPVISEPQQGIVPDNAPPEQQAEPPAAQNAPPAVGIEQQWRSYRVGEGKTLAQLFRDNNLPPVDVYAMAKVEGDGKPLSNLQSGQWVKIRQNANGVVTGLTIETNGQQVLFTRQPDGSFIRAR